MNRQLRPALVGALLAALLMTACARAPGGRQAVATPTAQQPQATPTAQQPEVAPAKPPQAETAWRSLTQAPGAVARRTVNPGQVINPATPGLYLFELASGKTEVWTLPGDGGEPAQVGYATSDDARYVLVRTPDKGYVVPRETAQAWQWDRTQFELTAAGAAGLLFEEVQAVSGDRVTWYAGGWGPGGQATGTGKFHFLNHNFQEQVAFTIPPGDGRADRPALFSPDDRQVAVATRDKLYLIDLTGGTARPVGEGMPLGRLTPTHDRAGFLAVPIPSSPEGTPSWRYDWQGKLVATLPPGDPSPDGALTAATTWVSGFTPAVVIADAATRTPKFRIVGAALCYGSGFPGSRWFSDGSAALVNTRTGVQLVSAGGSISQLAALKGEGWHEPYASPIQPGTFADRVTDREGGERLRVVDSAGKVQAEFQVGRRQQPGLEAALALPVWHPAGKFLQYSMYVRGGHDGPCGDYTIPMGPKVQRAPFPETLTVKVQQTGDCLNVRAEPSTGAARVACVKDGTALTIAPAADGKALGGLSAQTWNDGQQWARVRTADGKTGWVTLDGGFLAWAD